MSSPSVDLAVTIDSGWMAVVCGPSQTSTNRGCRRAAEVEILGIFDARGASSRWQPIRRLNPRPALPPALAPIAVPRFPGPRSGVTCRRWMPRSLLGPRA